MSAVMIGSREHGYVPAAIVPSPEAEAAPAVARPLPVELARCCDFLMDTADALVRSWKRGELSPAVWWGLTVEAVTRLSAAEGACRDE